MIVLALVSPYGCERFTDLYPVGMARLERCPLAIEAIGDTPRKAWGFSNFSVGSNGETGRGHFTVQVRGSKKAGEYQFIGARTFSTWTLTSARLLLEDEQKVIDVLTCSLEPQPGASPREMFAGLCEGGDASACLALGLMYDNPPPGESADAGQARSFKQRACDLGHVGACSLVRRQPGE